MLNELRSCVPGELVGKLSNVGVFKMTSKIREIISDAIAWYPVGNLMRRFGVFDAGGVSVSGNWVYPQQK